MSTEFRKLPGVDQLLSHPQIVSLEAEYPRAFIVNLVRKQLEEARRTIGAGKKCPTINEIVLSLRRYLDGLANLSLRPVINATGVILHTNLGRAPLSKKTVTAMIDISGTYSNLEFDVM